MHEITGELWSKDYSTDTGYVRAITTNGSLDKNGHNIMGGGCAKEAADRWPELPAMVGEFIRRRGNHVALFNDLEKSVFTFPTKNLVQENSSLKLIEQSAREIMGFVEQWDIKVVLPRPGCGLGGLEWETVKPAIEPILDDKFYIITWS